MSKKGICVINFPGSKARFSTLKDIVKILEKNFQNIILISSPELNELKDEIHSELIFIYHEKSENPIFRPLKYISTQIKITVATFKIIDDFDVAFFAYGSRLFLPLFLTKIFRKKIVIRMSGEKQREKKLDSGLYSKFLSTFQKLNLILADVILEKSSNNKSNYENEFIRDKVRIAEDHIIDTDQFKEKIAINDREKKVGYIGRLAKIKGVLEFANAVKIINKSENDVSFLIGGDGNQRDKMTSILQGKIGNHVEYIGWIEHQDLPRYLNKLKLLVIPSYSETGPRISVEAMACGTPVLATKVGIIPDLIDEGKNGFILENNDPETIAKRVKEIMKRDDLEEISKNAQELVKRKYTYDNLSSKYEKVFSELI